LPDKLPGSTFAACEKIRKPVRQLTDIAKKRPVRPIDGCSWPLNFLFQNPFIKNKGLRMDNFAFMDIRMEWIQNHIKFIGDNY
jgi:hypothetical protein